MDRCRLAFRSLSAASQPTTTFMSPSSIHHLHAELAVATDVTHAAAVVPGTGGGLPALRVQAVEKDGCWFALDSAQLELCRRLERGGVCRQVPLHRDAHNLDFTFFFLSLLLSVFRF